MAILQAVLFLFTSQQVLALSRAADCQPSTCSEGGVSIRFPFGLENQETFMSCAYDPLFTLRCNSSRKVVLNLPCCGDFFVRRIDYLTQQITLYDPRNCLPKRFLNLDGLSSSSSSPFAPLHHRNYTFLKCPKQALKNATNNVSSFSVIHCLGNSTVSVVATSSANATRALSEKACETYAADVRVPVSEHDGEDWISSSSGGGGDFRLGWSSADCRSCEAEGGVCAFAPYADYTIQSLGCNYYNSTPPPSPGNSARKKGTRIFLISVLCILFPGAILMACTGCFAYIRAQQHYRHLLSWSNSTVRGGTRAVQQNPTVGTTRTAPQTQRGEQNPVVGITRTAPQTQRGERNPVVGTTRTAPQTRRGAWNPSARPQPVPQSLAGQETAAPRRTNIDIRFYTIRVYGEEEDGGILPRPGQNTCAICQEDYQPEQRLGLMRGCQHSFHVHCLATWLQAKSTCPICRSSPICPQDIVTLGTTDMVIQRSQATGSNWEFFWTRLRNNTAMVFEDDGQQLQSANLYMSNL